MAYNRHQRPFPLPYSLILPKQPTSLMKPPNISLICYIWVELLWSCFFSCIVAQTSLTDLVTIIIGWISIWSPISPALFYPQSNFVGCSPHYCLELQCFYSWLSLSKFSRFFYNFQTNLLLHLNKVEQL